MDLERRVELKELLDKLDWVMRATSLWSVERPAEVAFRSTQPFCLDTMSFWSWLQYVFIPNIHSLLDLNQPLPRNCCILPMAEQAAAMETRNLADVLMTVARIDDCFEWFE